MNFPHKLITEKVDYYLWKDRIFRCNHRIRGWVSDLGEKDLTVNKILGVIYATDEFTYEGERIAVDRVFPLRENYNQKRFNTMLDNPRNDYERKVYKYYKENILQDYPERYFLEQDIFIF